MFSLQLSGDLQVPATLSPFCQGGSQYAQARRAHVTSRTALTPVFFVRCPEQTQLNAATVTQRQPMGRRL